MDLREPLFKFPYDINELERLCSEGYIFKRKHDVYPIWIYNYSPKTQFDRYWNDITLLCRGLILDENYNIIGRPIPKFFNFEEISSDRIPKESFEISDKMDGSMIMVTWYGDNLIVSSRGSFNSDQAIKASQILRGKKNSKIGDYDLDGLSFIFELITPENRIVCDYGDIEDLYLITVIINENGNELPYEVLTDVSKDIDCPLVERFQDMAKTISNLSSFLEVLQKLNTNNKEGFVIKYKSGFRIKVKFDEYKRLHKILTNVSTLTIWEYLKDNKSIDQLLESVPDEFYDWLKNEKNSLMYQFKTIENNAKKHFSFINGNSSLITKKDKALYVLQQPKTLGKVIFAMIDNKPYDHIIWNLIKPKFEKPFSKCYK